MTTFPLLINHALHSFQCLNHNPRNTPPTQMETTKPICFLLLIFFSSSFLNCLSTPVSFSELCPSSACRLTEPLIRFPFRLQDHQPTSCGHPGFNLFCDAFNKTLITLPNSGEFTVQAIDYSTQSIWLNDPGNCLPKRLLELNLSGSPFNGLFFQDFTLFNCTFDYRKYRFDPVACMSGEKYTVFASSSARTVRFLASRCSLVAMVAVPVQWEYFEPVMTADLGDDMRLTWASPRCRRCESRGGRCGFRSVNSTVVECRNVARRGIPKGERYAIIICAGTPAFLSLIGLVCFLCGRVRRNGRRRRRHIIEFSAAVAPTTTTTTAITGLDGPTIESYPKTVLGESCRLPKPDDSICTICLSEYLPKETLRSIPECQHCFHAECIDEWLRLKPSCPVCRNSPENSPSAMQPS